MRSRQDQLHAYQYSLQRVVAALVTQNPDPARSPLTRTGLTALAGLLVAAITLGAMFAYAAITGRSDVHDLRDRTAVVIEQETGAQYVYTGADDRLHPVVNYPSGLLIAESDRANPFVVRRSGLIREQRRARLQLGETLGIPGAPTSLPAPTDLIRDPWQLCTEGATADDPRPRSLLSIGGRITGGHTLVVPATATRAQALLVADPAGATHLIFGNHKFLIRKPGAVLAAFGWTRRPPIPVTAAWINAVPAGPDLQPLQIDRLRHRSAGLDSPIGQLYRAPGRGDEQLWAVVQNDGVLPITEVQAKLLDGDRDTKVGRPRTLSAAEFGALPTTRADHLPPGLDLQPATVPDLVTVAHSICAVIADAASGVSTVVVDADVPTDRIAPVSPALAAGAPTADRVSIPFGRGALVEPAASPNAPAGTSLPVLVTDTGRRYPIADREALTRLGYGRTPANRMPAELVALLPQGPVMGVQEAMRVRR